jgi:hypothetical protein
MKGLFRCENPSSRPKQGMLSMQREEDQGILSSHKPKVKSSESNDDSSAMKPGQNAIVTNTSGFNVLATGQIMN